MAYLTPVFALAWLFALGLVGEVDIAYLIAGTAAIVIVNTGLYIKMEYHRKGVCEPRGPSLD